MSDNQQPREYDVVLGGQSQSLERAAVLGGIEGVKFRFSNANIQVRVAILKQALNYGEQGLDLVLQALNDDSWQVQDAAYSLLATLTETRVKQALQQPNEQGLKLQPIEVVTVNSYGQVTQRDQCIARYFTEDLGNNVTLDMAAIPGGTFIMGAPETEERSFDSERPQHRITIQPFFMGKYPITRAQWKAVAALPKVNRYLSSDSFEANNVPVERVSWHCAIEFCARLSRNTGINYRLPSEAEWEYACRAGTTTPFHFGETISPELACYNGYHDVEFVHLAYGNGPKGKIGYHAFAVGYFPPNAFGLYDMHGNVSEWCADTWHKTYVGTPTDGSAWVSNDDWFFKEATSGVIRGGSWKRYPDRCRSAARASEELRSGSSTFGFRVSCDAVVKF